MIKTLDAKVIENTVYEHILKMNVVLPDDVKKALKDAAEIETGLSKKVFDNILKNIDLAEKKNMPMCQDTGMIVFFVDVGQDIHVDGNLETALCNAVERAYLDGYFRKSVVRDPLNGRKNTGNNLPPVIHYTLQAGQALNIKILAKGFGSENMSKVYMLKPTATVDTVIETVLDTIVTAGGSPCPPSIVGVGIGGTMEKAAILSKRALTRKLDQAHSDVFYAALEKKMLEKINKSGIGGGGLGGRFTSLAVKIEQYPTHIAGLPLAVSINCWADRKAEMEF